MRQSLILVCVAVLFVCGTGYAESGNSLAHALPLDSTSKETIPYGIQVKVDTVDVAVNGYLRAVALFNDRFYCMFETHQKNTSQTFKKMTVIDKRGGFVEDVFVPKGIQDMNYYRMFVDSQSLFLKRTQFKEETFVLEKYVANFKPTENRNTVLYSDTLYNVYQHCKGEWGGAVYFEDLKTKEVFRATSTCPIVVNRIENEYYVTNYLGHLIGFTSLIKVPDPSKLQQSQIDLNAEYEARYDQGVERIFDSANFYVPTSFVSNGKLLHLYSDEEGTYIGEIKNDEIVPVYKFGFRFFGNLHQQQRDGTQVLGFNLPDSDYKGIIVIDNGVLHFHIIK